MSKTLKQGGVAFSPKVNIDSIVDNDGNSIDWFDVIPQMESEREATDNQLGYKILSPYFSFESQVTNPNTIYEIRNSFSLSDNFTMPANCVLNFTGGKIKSNTLTLVDTLLEGNVRLECSLAGTTTNKELYTSWITKSDPTQIFKSFITLNKIVCVDCDLNTTRGTLSCENLYLKGINNPTIKGFGYFTVTGNISISGIKFVYNNTIGTTTFISVEDSSNEDAVNIHEININNITFDGNNYFSSFIKVTASNVFKYSVCNCNIYNIKSVAISCGAYTENAIINNNYIHDMGNFTSTTSGDVTSRNNVSAITIGSNSNYCKNVLVSHNYIEDIKCGFADGNDAGEAHGILVYGNSSTIEDNYINHLYTEIEGVEVDPGTDCEGLYIKGNECIIRDNVVKNANGSNSDATICAKGAQSIIVCNNIVEVTWGKGITIQSSTNNAKIYNNRISCTSGKMNAGILINTSSGSNNYYIDGNSIILENREEGNHCVAIWLYIVDNVIISNNFIIGTPVIVSTTRTDYIKNLVLMNNYYELSNISYTDEEFTTDGNYYRPVRVLANSANNILFKNNTVKLAGVELDSFVYNNSTYNNNILFKDNLFYIEQYTGENAVITNGYCNFENFIRGIKEFSDNKAYITTGSTITKFIYSPSNITLVRNNIFDADVMPVIDGANKISGNQLASYSNIGTSANRPSANSVSPGMSYFETNTHKTIYSDGTNWYYSDGTAVQ